MRAVICRAWGEVDSLRVEEIAPPAPAADEMLIDVRASAVNYADSIMVAGRYPDAAPIPVQPGHRDGRDRRPVRSRRDALSGR
jgi:NADPH2:quinone reductase